MHIGVLEWKFFWKNIQKTTFTCRTTFATKINKWHLTLATLSFWTKQRNALEIFVWASRKTLFNTQKPTSGLKIVPDCAKLKKKLFLGQNQQLSSPLSSSKNWPAQKNKKMRWRYSFDPQEKPWFTIKKPTKVSQLCPTAQN